MTTDETTTLTLVSFPADKKVTAIKAIRELTGVGLKEAKDFAENLPAVLPLLYGKSIEAAKETLQVLGAQVESATPRRTPPTNPLLEMQERTFEITSAGQSLHEVRVELRRQLGQ